MFLNKVTNCFGGMWEGLNDMNYMKTWNTEALAPSLKVDIHNFGVHMKFWVQKTKGYSHATVRYWFLKFCYDVTESYWRYCTYLVEREKKIKVGYSESYKQTLIRGLLLTISFLAFVLKPIILFLYQSEPVSVVPTIMSLKWKTSLQKTLRLD